MSIIKYDFSSANSLADSNGKIANSGLNSHQIVPTGYLSSFADNLSNYLQYDPGYVSTINNLNTSITNLDTNIRSYIDGNIQTIENSLSQTDSNIAAVTTQFGTFSTDASAASWYGVTLNTDNFVTGFSLGSLANTGPNGIEHDSFFKIAADKFIVGRSYTPAEALTDPTGFGYATMYDDFNQPIPAFGIEWNGVNYDIFFNGKVTIDAIPESVNKSIGSFADLTELNNYLLANPEVEVNEGDTYINTTENIVYMWNGTSWISTGDEAKYVSIVFLRSTLKPATPTGGDYDSGIPTSTPTWSDGIPSGTGNLWYSVHTFTNKADYVLNPPIWSEPQALAQSEHIQYRFNVSILQPPDPIDDGYNDGWIGVVPSGQEEFVIWAASRTSSNSDGDVVWSDWSIFKVKGETGADGLDGSDGSRGSAILSESGTGAFSPVAATALFNSKFGNVISGDQYVWSSDTDGTYIYTYNGSIWTDQVGIEINGDAIITGTCVASNIFSTNGITGVFGQFNTSNGTSSANIGGINLTWTISGETADGSGHQGGGFIGNTYGAAAACHSDSGFGLFGVGQGSTTGAADGVAGNTTTGRGVVGHSNGSGVGGFFYNDSSGEGLRSEANRAGPTAFMENTSTGAGIEARSAGTYGFYTPDATYSAGGVFPFTGSHIVYSNTLGNKSTGDIVYSIDAWTAGISQTLVHVDSAFSSKDTRCIGVVNSVEDTLGNAFDNSIFSNDIANRSIVEKGLLPARKEVKDSEWEIKSEYKPYIDYMLQNKFTEVKINSLGEGGINVCEIGGNIKNGDYICSSELKGKGMKQPREYLAELNGTTLYGPENQMMAYTVAKALETVDWDNEIIGEGYCFEQDGYKCKMIACTYHCG